MTEQTRDPLMADVDITPDFVRNGKGQPMIVPADGGKPVPYSRPSGFGKKLEDTFALEQWQRRMVTIGLARTPSLIAEAAVYPGNPKSWSKEQKAELNDIASRAQTAAKANEASDIGTAEHRMTEHIDLGEDMGHLPEPFKSDMAAYVAGMKAHGLEIACHPDDVNRALVECRLVCDELRLAGTADRILMHGLGYAIFDLKTGESIDLAILGYAVQLAIYSRSDLYDVATGKRTPLPGLSHDVAYIAHLPAGEARFDLYEIDVEAGWQAALCADEIATWRKRGRDGSLAKVISLSPPASAWPTETEVARTDQIEELVEMGVERSEAETVMADSWAPPTTSPPDADPWLMPKEVGPFDDPPAAPSWGPPQVGGPQVPPPPPVAPPATAERPAREPQGDPWAMHHAPVVDLDADAIAAFAAGDDQATVGGLQPRALGRRPHPAGRSYALEERIANLKERCRWIGANKPHVAERLRQNLIIGSVSLVRTDLTEADVAAATHIIEQHEAQADAPFTDLPPPAGVKKPNNPERSES